MLAFLERRCLKPKLRVFDIERCTWLCAKRFIIRVHYKGT